MERLKRVSAEQKRAEELDQALHKAHEMYEGLNPEDRYNFLDEFNLPSDLQGEL